MIYLIFAVIGLIIAFYLGVIITEKKYEKVIAEQQDSYEKVIAEQQDSYEKGYVELQLLFQKKEWELNAAWEKHCRALREQYQNALMSAKLKSTGEKFVLERTHDNEPCIFREKEKYRNVTVVISECKKCGHTDISWIRQDDTEEVEVEE